MTLVEVGRQPRTQDVFSLNSLHLFWVHNFNPLNLGPPSQGTAHPAKPSQAKLSQAKPT